MHRFSASRMESSSSSVHLFDFLDRSEQWRHGAIAPAIAARLQTSVATYERLAADVRSGFGRFVLAIHTDAAVAQRSPAVLHVALLVIAQRHFLFAGCKYSPHPLHCQENSFSQRQRSTSQGIDCASVPIRNPKSNSRWPCSHVCTGRNNPTRQTIRPARVHRRSQRCKYSPVFSSAYSAGTSNTAPCSSQKAQPGVAGFPHGLYLAGGMLSL